MFSGEAEVQARRRILVVLQDEAKMVMGGAREMARFYLALSKNDSAAVHESMANIRKVEDDVEELTRGLTRELADIGAMIMNREDVLRASHSIAQIAAYMSGIAFRFSQLKLDILKSEAFGDDMSGLVDMAVEIVHQLNEVLMTLTLNPTSTLNLASGVEKMEREIDDKYRALTVKVMKEIKSISNLILLKDIIERLEALADACLTAVDSITILALGL